MSGFQVFFFFKQSPSGGWGTAWATAQKKVHVVFREREEEGWKFTVACKTATLEYFAIPASHRDTAVLR